MNKEEIENLEEVKKEVHHKKEHKDKHNKEIERLINEKNELNDKLLRVTAEMQNIRRRQEEELRKIYKYEGEELIKKLLNTLDNFERAINMDDENLDDEVSKFLSGFKLIYTDLRNILEDMKVKEIECLNTPFDPEKMEAVLTEKVDDKESGMVIEVLRKGYTYNDKVIRAAMVKVSE
jgi:molecular chaperone GrpE